MLKFKKGDRVKIIAGEAHKGEMGTIVTESEVPGIHLDLYSILNHNCAGSTPKGHGYWTHQDRIELIYEQGSLDYILYAPPMGEEVE